MNQEDNLDKKTREVQSMQSKDHADKMFKRFQLLNKGQRKSEGNDV